MSFPDTLQIAQRAFNTPLMLDPAKAAVIAQQLGPRFLGQAGARIELQGFDGRITDAHRTPRAASLLGDEVHQRARRVQSYSNVQGIAVIPITGSLVRRGSFIGESSGVTSYEGLSAQLRAAAEDDAVRVIALEIDSFGGEAAGIFDLGQQIREIREIKPVRAFIADYALSAGYAIASQANHITVPPFGEAGSVGVVCMHVDYEGYLEKEGIKVTLIHSGANKVDGNPYQALSENVREQLQREGDEMWSAFALMVEAGRRGAVSAEDALATEAAVFRGQAAVEIGFADEVSEARAAFAALIEEVNPAVRPIGGRAASAGLRSALIPDRDGAVAAGETSDKVITAGLAARSAPNAVPAPAAKETSMDWKSLTSAALREHRADLVSEIETEAAAKAETGNKAAVDSAVEKAVAAERARIAAIDEIAVAGHEELVAAAKADGRTAEQLALDMVKADKKAGGGYLAGLREADAAAAVPQAPAPSDATASGVKPEETAEAKWDKDADLRAEFGGDKAAYLAFAKAEASGHARILRRTN